MLHMEEEETYKKLNAKICIGVEYELAKFWSSNISLVRTVVDAPGACHNWK